MWFSPFFFFFLEKNDNNNDDNDDKATIWVVSQSGKMLMQYSDLGLWLEIDGGKVKKLCSSR